MVRGEEMPEELGTLKSCWRMLFVKPDRQGQGPVTSASTDSARGPMWHREKSARSESEEMKSCMKSSLSSSTTFMTVFEHIEM